MTAKQCLRHNWLRSAPMQASPHLRRYLSKSREVLLERVVSRENLRRAALMSQTTSQANLCVDNHDQSHQRQGLQDCPLSQSEICLNQYESLAGSEGFPSPTDSQTSLNSSGTNLSCASQSCLLNQEQTQGLLSEAQSRSHSNLNQGLSRGILSRIRSLNRVQSQACLLNGSTAINSERSSAITSMNLAISKSREKLYGLKCLSKSQGVLDIYRSLECLKRRRKSYQRAQTDDMLPIFKQFDASCKLALSISDNRAITYTKSGINSIPNKIEEKIRNHPIVASTNASDFNDDKRDSYSNSYSRSSSLKWKTKRTDLLQTPEKFISESEENLNSLKSIESDTLTEDSDEMPPDMESSIDKHLCEYSDASSCSNNSVASDNKEDYSTESENEKPKYTVAQLVSAFNKHQEVASKTSLKAIMSEKKINKLTFPTGTKALRLFFPDINIIESKIIRRKTSYKPRKNWENLRKHNENNERLLKNFDNNCCNEDHDDDDDEIRNKSRDLSAMWTNEQDSAKSNVKESAIDISRGLIGQNEKTNISQSQWLLLQPESTNEKCIFVDNVTIRNNLDITIDEKYKQCVKGAMASKIETPECKIRVHPKLLETQSNISEVHRHETLPKYICSDVTYIAKDDKKQFKRTAIGTINEKLEPRILKIEPIKSNLVTDTANVNLKDILQRVDSSQNSSKENLENLRKRTSIAKITLNDNLVYDHLNCSGDYGTGSQAKSESPAIDNQSDEQVKLESPSSFIRSFSLSSDTNCPTLSSVQPDTSMSWEDVQVVASSSTYPEKDSCNIAKKRIQRTSSKEKNKQCTEDRKVWGRVCTGSYTRAMERFTSKNINATRKSSSLTQQMEKTRRKSSPTMTHYINF